MGDEQHMKNGVPAIETSASDKRSYSSLWRFLGYFLKLGTIGFGGPVALAGFMNQDEGKSENREGYSTFYFLKIILPFG